ncbi:hypothetical protein DGG96_13475 [Legionella qingyii]|uniref:Uncharacterized protein n=1 Tax=Legionella qingyii TaxID=2184757 RepID=A0A317U1T1_9GAMM|nr:hypothetical protein [Legionella qingyii]PWY55185.1 hypothetical protein DGG96_13475 [Legionella qingyii]RUR25393.1 hypothetical protein ELY20_02755 [Legionella qingyii]RUR28496.1 hypothetical protein ELY16_03255 [Legionella qingyii]
MSEILARQATDLLKRIRDKKQRIILEHITKKSPPDVIADITSFEPAKVLISLMAFFPVNIEEKKSAYIDFLAQYFPEILCSTMFMSREKAAKWPPVVIWQDITEVLHNKLSTELDFANYYLDYYTLLMIKDSSQHVPNIDLGQIAPAAAKNYCEQNKLDKGKFFNQFLGGFGRSVVSFIFGYGVLYQFLYGRTHDQIAEDLQAALSENKDRPSDFSPIAPTSEAESGLTVGEELIADAEVYIDQPPTPTTSPAKVLGRLASANLPMRIEPISPDSTSAKLPSLVSSTPLTSPSSPSPSQLGGSMRPEDSPDFADSALATKDFSTPPAKRPVLSQSVLEFSPVKRGFTYSPVKKSLSFSPVSKDSALAFSPVKEGRTTFFFQVSGNNSFSPPQVRRSGDLSLTTIPQPRWSDAEEVPSNTMDSKLG